MNPGAQPRFGRHQRRSRHASRLARTLDVVSAQREELHHLVDDLPEEMVPAVLADLRTRATPPEHRPWPPRWFGAAKARTPDVSEHIDDILRAELGQR